jgi:molecular chaperone GrpE
VSSPETEFDPERVVVRDKRRLDPDSGALREQPAGSGEAAAEGGSAAPDPAAPDAPAYDGDAGSAGAEGATADERVAELTADLQRVTAEYANYRKRVERDRLAVVEQAVGTLLSELLPLLDDVDRARQHDDLTGAFKGVGEALEAVVAKLGLERFGEPGEPFDPAVHEALMQAEPDPSSTVATCAQVLQPGYRVGARVLRPARVSVAEPGA